jgi:hypothetical protein
LTSPPSNSSLHRTRTGALQYSESYTLLRSPVRAGELQTLGDRRVVKFREYDIVRIIRLDVPNRLYLGTETVKRAPRIGDVATICHQDKPEDPTASVVVEMVDQNGCTLWLADFSPGELELVTRAKHVSPN